MSKGKRNGNEDQHVKILILVTAILNLVKALIDLISKLTE